jgi:hypothetical protein
LLGPGIRANNLCLHQSFVVFAIFDPMDQKQSLDEPFNMLLERSAGFKLRSTPNVVACVCADAAAAAVAKAL